MFWRISIPVDSYYGDEVAFENIYVEVDRAFLTKERILAYLDKKHEEWKNDPEYLGIFHRMYPIISSITNWPCLGRNWIYTTAKCFHPKWKDQVVTFELLKFEVI